MPSSVSLHRLRVLTNRATRARSWLRTMAKQSGLLQLALCALTIYTMFLMWGLLQEKSMSSATDASHQHGVLDG